MCSYNSANDYSGGATINATPVSAADVTPPSDVTNFSASVGNAQAGLTWTNPGADFAGVVMVRSAVSSLAGFPLAGQSYPAGSAIGNGTVIYNSTGTSFTDAGRTNGTTYYYTAYSFDAARNYAYGVSGLATPVAPAGDTVSASVVTYNWVTATDGTLWSPDAGNTDDGSKLVNIGFNFSFYGTSYSQLKISSNGHVVFGSSSATEYNNVAIPNTNQPNNFIAPFWDDLNPASGGAIYYKTTGSSPNQKFIVQWNGVPHYPSEGSYTFQLILQENGEILFQYNTMSGQYANGNSATWGTENQDGMAGRSMFPVSGIYNNLALRIYSDTQTQATQANATFTRADAAAGLSESLGGDGLAWGDYNNDSYVDIFVLVDGANPFLYKNNGNQTFTNVAGSLGITGSATELVAPVWGDFDNNGGLDLLASNTSGQSYLYKNNGTGSSFSKITGSITNVDADAEAVAVLDYDRDGDLDLFVTSAGGQDRLYNNTGAGDFVDSTSSAGILTETANGEGVSWADYDNDGDLDIFVANEWGNPSYLYRNNGNGTFTEVAASAGINGVFAADAPLWLDYDNDGDFDLFIANWAQAPRVYKNNGNGTFTDVSSSSGVTDSSYCNGTIAAGDYDNDGDMDVIINNYYQQILYRNNGNGTFSNATTSAGVTDYTTGWDEVAAFADYDNDGDLDLYLGGPGQDILYKNNLVENGSGGRNYIKVIALTDTNGNASESDAQPDRLAIGAKVEVDLDGAADFAPGFGRYAEALIGAGDGWDYYQGPGHLGVGSATSVDVRVTFPDGDVIMQEAVAVNQTIIVMDTTLGIFVNPVWSDFGDGVYRSSIAWGDYDADFDVDLAVSGIDYWGYLRFYILNNSDSEFFSSGPEPMGANYGIYYASIAWGDYDNDGKLDIAVAGLNRFIIFRNAGNDSFINAAEPMGFNAGLSDPAIAWADYDRDNDLDIAVSGVDFSNNKRLVIFQNNGSGTFSNAAEPMGMNAGVSNSSIGWADYDGDLDMDLAVSGWSGTSRRLIIFRNDGNGIFTNVAEPMGTNAGVNYSSLSWADYDNDGDPDLAITGLSSSLGAGTKNIIIFRNDGDGAFTRAIEPMAIDSGVYKSSIAWGDYDADGYLDLAVAGLQSGTDRRLIIYRNSGDGRFTNMAEPMGPNVGVDEGSIAWVDRDEDGDLDLTVSGYDGANRRLIVFKNNLPGKNFVKFQIVTDSNGNAEESDAQPDRTAIGAKVEVDLNGGGDFVPGADYAMRIVDAASPLVVGIRTAAAVDIRVTFPDGDVAVRRGVAANQTITIKDPPAVTATISSGLYQSEIVAYNWLDISATGNRLSDTTNDTLLPTNIGFNFNYFGKNYSRLMISSNGFVTFDTTLIGGYPVNQSIPGGAQPNNTIAPFWDDLNPEAGGNIYYRTSGSYPTRQFIVQWEAVPHSPNEGSHTFQMILYETLNEIVFQYKNMTGIYANGNSATWGIENETGTVGSSSFPISTISNQQALRIYPRPVNSPPIKAASPFPSNGATNQSLNAFLSWADGGGATSYDVYFGTSPIHQASDSRASRSVTSYQPQLAMGKTYYWRIDARNAYGLTRGDVWQFSTDSDPVSAYSIRGPTTNAWYRAINNVFTVQVVPPDTISGAISYIEFELENLADSYSAMPSSEDTVAPARDYSSDTNGWSLKFDARNLSHGFGYRVRVRAGDSDGFATSWHYTSEFGIDKIAPQAPSSVISATPPPNAPSSLGTITVNWSGASDSGAGVAGYSVLWSKNQSDTPDLIKDVDTPTSSYMISSKGNWYVHVRTVDRVGLVSPGVFHVGPFVIGTDTPTFTAGQEPLDVPVLWSSIDWGDYDNDGDQDIVIAGLNTVGNYRLIVYRNDGGIFTVASEPMGNYKGVKYGSVDWGDYDGDADLDLAVIGDDGTNKRLIIYQNAGNSGFTAASQPMGSNTGLTYSSIQWGDYDGDGDLDLAACGFDGTNTRLMVIRNNGGNNFSIIVQPLGATAGLSNCAVQWGDYDRDGDLDFAAAGTADGSPDAPRFIVFKNIGGDSFIKSVEPMGANSGFYDGSLDWGDYDNDGDLDLVVSGASGADEYLVVFKNIGNDSFAKALDPMGANAGVFWSSVNWGDYDNDGKLDLVIAGTTDGLNNRLIVYRNEGNGVLSKIAEPLGTNAGINGGAARWGNYDNDADLDLAVSGYDGTNRRLIFLKNNTPTILSAQGNIIGGSSRYYVTNNALNADRVNPYLGPDGLGASGWTLSGLVGGETVTLTISQLQSLQIDGVTDFRYVSVENSPSDSPYYEHYSVAQDNEGNIRTLEVWDDGGHDFYTAAESLNSTGFIMIPATPVVGTTYTRTRRHGAVEKTKILSKTATVTLPSGLTFTNCLVMSETGTDWYHADTVYYAPGVGLIKFEDDHPGILFRERFQFTPSINSRTGNGIDTIAFATTGNNNFSGIRVYIRPSYDSSLATASGTTDTNGGIDLESIPDGEYKIELKASGSLTRRVSFTVLNGVINGGAGITIPPLIKGDANGSGDIGPGDWSVVVDNWGATSPDADSNNSGDVGPGDWSVIVDNWGQTDDGW